MSFAGYELNDPAQLVLVVPVTWIMTPSKGRSETRDETGVASRSMWVEANRVPAAHSVSTSIS